MTHQDCNHCRNDKKWFYPMLIVGPMFASKTKTLLAVIGRYLIARKKCVLVKSVKNTRYDLDYVVAHDKTRNKQETTVLRTKNLLDIKNDLQSFDVIGIDEGQMFEDLFEFVFMFFQMGKQVVVSGLDADFMMRPFSNVCSLFALTPSECVIKLKAVCVACGEAAPHTKRLTDDTETELIGGEEKYAPVCISCYQLNPDVIKSYMTMTE